jgi:glycogen debranching enzyme
MKGLAYERSMFAGFPWFFQFWSRDSAISLKALIDSGEYKAVKEILHEILLRMDSEGNIKAASSYKIQETLNSADALGWLCLRLSQLVSLLSSKGILRKYISKKEEKEIISRIENAVFLTEKFRTKDSFAVNGPNETWMDTDFGNDSRPGARIEIQALRLALYRLAFELTKKKKFRESENNLKELVYKKFWNGNYLNDGLDDQAVRPNVFLAAYIYPGLLSKDEWIRCFSSVIPALWLEWGGLSSIDKSSSLFCSEYTGQNNRSYHRGDSWFWINNYAALVMAVLGSGNFRQNKEKIIEASCEEILWKGMLACHAELSSAKELRSEGCWSQLWSSASFIEMVNELYLKK